MSLPLPLHLKHKKALTRQQLYIVSLPLPLLCIQIAHKQPITQSVRKRVRCSAGTWTARGIKCLQRYIKVAHLRWKWFAPSLKWRCQHGPAIWHEPGERGGRERDDCQFDAHLCSGWTSSGHTPITWSPPRGCRHPYCPPVVWVSPFLSPGHWSRGSDRWPKCEFKSPDRRAGITRHTIAVFCVCVCVCGGGILPLPLSLNVASIHTGISVSTAIVLLSEALFTRPHSRWTSPEIQRTTSENRSNRSRKMSIYKAPCLAGTLYMHGILQCTVQKRQRPAKIFS